MSGDDGMSEKYSAISDLARLRELNRIPSAGCNHEEGVPKASEHMNKNLTANSSTAS